MKNTDRSEMGSNMLLDGRGWQPRFGMSEAVSLAQKLRALTDENAYLERHLAALVSNNQVLQSLRSRKPSFKF